MRGILLSIASNFTVEFFRENILINDNVMECCRIYEVKKLVSFLSTWYVRPNKFNFFRLGFGLTCIVPRLPQHFSRQGFLSNR